MYPRTNGGVGAAPVDGNRGRRCKPYRSGSATVRVPDDRSLIDLGAVPTHQPRRTTRRRLLHSSNAGAVASIPVQSRHRASACARAVPRPSRGWGWLRSSAGLGRQTSRTCVRGGSSPVAGGCTRDTAELGEDQRGSRCRRRLCVYIDRAAGIGRCLRLEIAGRSCSTVGRHRRHCRPVGRVTMPSSDQARE